MPFLHRPVLLEQTVSALTSIRLARVIDGTLGGGGHTEALLQAQPDCQVLAIDRDANALAAARERLAPFGERVHFHHGTFSHMAEAAKAIGWNQVDGILLDIGVSSPQIDTPERGFSFRYDAPLDMRMNQEDSLTAADILNTYSEAQLGDIFFRYGEERKSRAIAHAVVAMRDKTPWKTTGQFAALLEQIVGRAHQHGLPPATRCFQALRIEVNHELEELQQGLESAVALLAPGGRLAVITFHSLEDRLVKFYFREQASSCTCPPGLPVCVCGKVATLDILTHKPIMATPEELEANPRAASAKLRVAAKRQSADTPSSALK